MDEEKLQQGIDPQWITVFVEINRRIMKTLAEKGGLTVTQYRILFELHGSQTGLPGAVFAKILLLNHSSITGALNGLEKYGYISREETANNKRAITVRILEKGEAAFEQASEAITAMLDDIWRPLSSDQIGLVIKSTRDIVSALRDADLNQDQERIPPYYVTAIVHVNSVWTSLLKTKYQVSLTEFRILLQLLDCREKNRGIDLASALILDTSMVSISIAKLEKIGLVSRTKDRFDKRNYHVDLTEKGRWTARDARADLTQINQGFYQPVPLDEQKKLHTIARLMYRIL